MLEDEKSDEEYIVGRIINEKSSIECDIMEMFNVGWQHLCHENTFKNILCFSLCNTFESTCETTQLCLQEVIYMISSLSQVISRFEHCVC